MQKSAPKLEDNFGIIKYMNNELRDEIFMRTNEVRYAEDRAETAYWLANEYARLLTDEQGREYLDSILEQIAINRSQER